MAWKYYFTVLAVGKKMRRYTFTFSIVDFLKSSWTAICSSHLTFRRITFSIVSANPLWWISASIMIRTLAIWFTNEIIIHAFFCCIAHGGTTMIYKEGMNKWKHWNLSLFKLALISIKSRNYAYKGPTMECSLWKPKSKPSKLISIIIRVKNSSNK